MMTELVEGQAYEIWIAHPRPRWARAVFGYTYERGTHAPLHYFTLESGEHVWVWDSAIREINGGE